LGFVVVVVVVLRKKSLPWESTAAQKVGEGAVCTGSK
jgi:hypothetical protein